MTSTMQTWSTKSMSLEETLLLAAQMGRKLRGGEIIELVSDLGGGKTAFVRGLSQGLGSNDTVHSPSFILANQYQAGAFTLHHFDFYRLQEAGILKQELTELLDDPKVVTVIEWADLIKDVLPTDHLTVGIKTTGETSREFTISYPKKLRYLLPNKS